MKKTLIPFIAFLAVTACDESSHESVESEKIPNHRIKTTFELIQEGEGEALSILTSLEYTNTIKKDPSPDIRLSGDESVHIHIGEQVVISHSAGEVSPFIDTYTEEQVSVFYKAVFNRRSGDPIVIANIAMPPDYQIIAPKPADILLYSEPFDIEWSNSNPVDTIEIDMNLSCADTKQYRYVVEVKDMGAYSVNLTKAKWEQLGADAFSTIENEAACRLSYSLSRINIDTHDSQFESGSVQARRSRSENNISTIMDIEKANDKDKTKNKD